MNYSLAIAYIHPNGVVDCDESTVIEIRKAKCIVALLLDEPSEFVNAKISHLVQKSNTELFAAWGSGSEKLHDAVDLECLQSPSGGPVTVWDTTSTLSEFLWNVAYPFQGLIRDADPVRRLMILVISIDRDLSWTKDALSVFEAEIPEVVYCR